MPHPAPLTSLFSPLPSPLPSGGGLRLRLRHDRRREDEARRRRARVWHQDDPLCPLRRCAAAPLVAMHRGGGSFQTRPASPATDSASHAHTPCPYVPARKKRKLPLPTAHAGTSSNRNLTNYELAWPRTHATAPPSRTHATHATLACPPPPTPLPHMRHAGGVLEYGVGEESALADTTLNAALKMQCEGANAAYSICNTEPCTAPCLGSPRLSSAQLTHPSLPRLPCCAPQTGRRAAAARRSPART